MRRPGEAPDQGKGKGPGGRAKERLKQFEEQRGLPEKDPETGKKGKPGKADKGGGRGGQS